MSSGPVKSSTCFWAGYKRLLSTSKLYCLILKRCLTVPIGEIGPSGSLLFLADGPSSGWRGSVASCPPELSERAETLSLASGDSGCFWRLCSRSALNWTKAAGQSAQKRGDLVLSGWDCRKCCGMLRDRHQDDSCGVIMHTSTSSVPMVVALPQIGHLPSASASASTSV